MASRFPTVFSSLRMLPTLALALTGAAGSAIGNEADLLVAARSSVGVVSSSAGGSQRSNCGISSFDTRVLDLVNRLRISGASCGSRGSFPATRPLGWNHRLSLSADRHALDMAMRNYFGHVSAGDGRSPAHRISAAGYDWGQFGENLAAGVMTVEDVVARWAGSPSHCANLMNPDFTELGAACVPAMRPGRFRTYWAMDLAGP